MPEGHAARRSERDGIFTEVSSSGGLEIQPRPPVAVPPRVLTPADAQEQLSLPEYKLPRPKRAASLRPRIITEAALIGGPTDQLVESPQLPDAAVASFGNPIVLEVVIGNDDRLRVKEQDVRRNPFRQICALRIKAVNGAMYVGTGWFVGPRAVATAGHCVYLHKEGGWAASIDVIPAKFGAREPYPRMTAKKFRTVDGWILEKRQDLDYGIILIDDETTGNRVGWFETEAQSDQQLSQALANISGYPADRDRAEFQFFHARPLGKPLPTRVEYDIDTFGGQSGSPIWVKSSTGVVAVGIHTTGAATGNSGTRITEPVIDNLLAWRDE